MGCTNRRDFIRKAALGGMAAGFTFLPRRIPAVSGSPFRRVVYRDLGSTGFRVSEIGFGAMNMRDPELVHAAIDSGINYIDTANFYMRGANEEIIGQVMKTRRDRVFLETKVGLSKDLAAIPGEIETSLKRLQTDHVDLLMYHKLEDRAGVLDDSAMKLFETARDRGQARFIGISTHSNQEEVIDAAIESSFWEAVLVGYNYYSPPNVIAVIQRAREAGLAVIAMKNLITMVTPPSSRTKLKDIRTDSSIPTSPEQALIKWVLENRYVDTTIPGMTSFEQLEDDLEIMGMRLAFDDNRSNPQVGEHDAGYCRGVAGCTGCRDRCPRGVAINEIIRCLRYHDGYGDPDLARAQYEALPRSNRLDLCDECGECPVHCFHGVNIAGQIRRARSLFL